MASWPQTQTSPDAQIRPRLRFHSLSFRWEEEKLRIKTLMTASPATPGNENARLQRRRSFNNLRVFSEEANSEPGGSACDARVAQGGSGAGREGAEVPEKAGD